MSTCYASASTDFWPAMRLILSITNSYPAVITTTNRTEVVGGVLVAVAADHEYTSGIIVRVHIPTACGMQNLHGFVGEITVINDTTFSIDVDTTSFDAFSIPVVPFPVWLDTCAQIIPIGEDNDMLTEATRNIRG